MHTRSDCHKIVQHSTMVPGEVMEWDFCDPSLMDGQPLRASVPRCDGAQFLYPSHPWFLLN